MGSDFIKLYSELGIKIAERTSDNVTAFCPLHKDTEKASFAFNFNTGLYKCFVATCPGFKGGNFAQLYEKLTKKKWEEDIDEDVVLHYHKVLLESKETLKWLYDQRGFNDETIKKFKLGWDGYRLTIPIYSKGRCLNIRRHSPQKGDQAKTISFKPGFGKLRLFPESNLQNKDCLVLCEGELDAILCNQHGINAITATGGAGSWDHEFTKALSDRPELIILYDIDQPGRDGAAAVANALSSKIPRIKDVLLPITSPPNGDVTDFLVAYSNSVDSLRKLFDDAPLYVPSETNSRKKITEAVDVTLAEASKPELLGQKIKVRAVVMGLDSTPYAASKRISVACKSAGNLKICSLCPINQSGGSMQEEILPDSQDMLRLIDYTEEQIRGFLRKKLNIYPGCPRWDYETTEFHVLHDIRIIPEINFSSTPDTEYIVRQGFCVGNAVRANSTYEFEGVPYPHPKNQYLTYVMGSYKAVRDNLQDFKLTENEIKSLEIFKATDKTVEQRMFDIAHDLSTNVTHIYEREKLIEVCDLVYHSPLQFMFQGRLLKKGWTEALILGDTRCGKSETLAKLVDHYQAGEIVTGENTSVAGLLGGVQQIGSRWITTWGKIPINDRRLLIIDEISGMSVDDMGLMSGVRSSGIAEIVKIQAERTFARTRLIWSGNPRSPRPLASYDTGIQAIKELIGRPEDIARFDIAITVASGEVSIESIHAKKSKVQHVYVSSLCNKLVLWSWSRKVEHIRITADAERACLTVAEEMSKKYSSTIPLVEGNEQRVKIMRLAVAAACRTFSTNDGIHVEVTADHVSYIHRLLETLYNSGSMNYGAYSKAKIADQILKNRKEVEAITKAQGGSFVDEMLGHQYLRLSDLEDILDKEKKEVKSVISVLLRNRALKHFNTMYIKTPAYIQLLRELQDAQIPEAKPKEVEF